MSKKYYFIDLCILGILIVLATNHLFKMGALNKVNASFVVSDAFRAQQFDEGFLNEVSEDYINGSNEILSREVAYYLLEDATERHVDWDDSENWDFYLAYCEAIWKDVQYFPVVESSTNSNYTFSYVDT
ncbi:MAG: hypothetical protein R3Y58_01110 [Eubacteriales bacterium]